MDSIQQLVNKAQELRDENRLQEALACYSDAFDLLVKDADDHARKIEDSIKDVGTIRALTPTFFVETKKYLKQDRTQL